MGPAKEYNPWRWAPPCCLWTFCVLNAAVFHAAAFKAVQLELLDERWASAFFICYYVVASLFLISLYKATKSDPGRVPFGYFGVNRTQVETKHCQRCGRPRPDPRVHHCSRCGDCIVVMDHHCPYLDNCVGLRNHKYFFLMMNYGIIAGIQTLYLLAIDANAFWQQTETLGFLLAGAAIALDAPILLWCANYALIQFFNIITNSRLLDIYCICQPPPWQNYYILTNLYTFFGESILMWPLPVRPIWVNHLFSGESQVNFLNIDHETPPLESKICGFLHAIFVAPCSWVLRGGSPVSHSSSSRSSRLLGSDPLIRRQYRNRSYEAIVRV